MRGWLVMSFCFAMRFLRFPDSILCFLRTITTSNKEHFIGNNLAQA